MKFIYILLGGATGSLLRYFIAEFLSSKNTTSFPIGTFAVNIIGSLLIGFLFGLFSVNGTLDEKLKYLVFIGFLGGFTTFSSFALENMRLLTNGLFNTAIFYIILSNTVGVLVAFGGYYFALKLK